ncbi:MAG: endonuclease [Bacteroidia bacterium]|nr:endonuclease [Bacteroidia bacterium]
MIHIRRLFVYGILAMNVFFAGMLLLSAYSPYLHPLTRPLLSCMGLTFPIFLLANLLFFLFWLLVNYRYAALSLVTLLVCYQQIGTYIPIHGTSDVPKGAIKVLSYNVMGFNGLKKVDGQNRILTYLTASEAEVICLQEYADSRDSKHLTSKEILSALKAYPYHHTERVGSKGGNRIACFSKYPILSAKRVRYESAYNGSMAYELKVNDDTVLLVNNHLESNKLTKEDKVVYEDLLNKPRAEKVKSGLKQLVRKLAEASAIRSKQAEAVARFIQESPCSYKIVCGDFNDASISYTHRILSEELDDTFTESGRGLGISYNQNKFFFRIDNILISRNWAVYNCTVDRSIKESDHYPIWCYIQRR